jgi:tetratricopeptide (TPR) repeat protein
MLRTQLRLLPGHARVLRGQVLSQLAYAESQLRLLPHAARHADEAIELLDAPDSLRQLVTALRIAGMAHVYAGDGQRARERLDRGVEVAERIGLLEEAAGCVLNSGLIVLVEDPAFAAYLFRDALARFERLGRPSGMVQAHGNLADALCRAGELDEAEVEVGRALSLASRIGHQLTRADATWTRAKVQLARGLPVRAADTAELAASLFLELDDVDEARECLLLAERAATQAEDADRARTLGARALSLTQ